MTSVLWSLVLAVNGQVAHALPPALGPLDNPLKGFAAYSDVGTTHTCPTSMAFEETSWAELEPQAGVFAFDEWEKQWDSPIAKGKPVVIRVFADYPAKKVATPKWLVDHGVKMTHYDEFGGGQSPDYENGTLRLEMGKLIAALGKRYDRDPRVAFVQMGFLGHWGEWHDYPRDELFASPKVQSEVVDQVRKAFPHKQIMARNASYASCRRPWMGFYDDLLPQDTLGSENWKFWTMVEKAGLQDNWKVAPTGGEMVPGAAKQYLGTDWPTMTAALEKAHFSFVGPYGPSMVDEPSDAFNKRRDELVRRLGYEYRLTQLDSPDRVIAGSALSLSLSGVNQGVAPFYYPWRLRFGLMDGSGSLAQALDSNEDIRKWLPGAFRASLTTTVNVKPGHYRLVVGILDPASGKASIKFANNLAVADGYTVLGDMDVVKGLTN